MDPTTTGQMTNDMKVYPKMHRVGHCGPIQTHGASQMEKISQNKTEVQTLQARIFLNPCQSGSSLSPTTRMLWPARVSALHENTSALQSVVLVSK